MKKTLISLISVLLLSISSAAQEYRALLDSRTRDLLHEALSGELAKDHASGSAAMLDMARALKELIDGGRLPRPMRYLRFGSTRWPRAPTAR